MSENKSNIKPSEKMVQDFLYPKGGVTPIYAICEVLQIPAYAVAEALEITRPRMSHYRTGDAPIPEKRIQETLKFLRTQISEIEKEIARERKKSPSKVTSLLIAELDRRVELARKIADMY